MMNKISRNEQMTPQLLGDDIINIQNVEEANLDLPTDKAIPENKLQAINENQNDDQPSALRQV